MKSKPTATKAAPAAAEQELMTNAECEQHAAECWDIIVATRALLQLGPYQHLDEAKRRPKMTLREFEKLKGSLQQVTKDYAATLVFMSEPEEPKAAKSAKKPKKAAA